MTAANRSVPHLLGAAFVLVTVVLWIAASFLAQSLVRPDKWGKQPQLPALLLVYICTSLFVVYLPIIHFKRTLVHSRQVQHSRPHNWTHNVALTLLQREAVAGSPACDYHIITLQDFIT